MADVSSSEVSPQSVPLGVPYYALDTLELIGRQAELAAITQALDAHVGQSTTDSHVIVFRGPGGVGKTRLLRAAVEQAQVRHMLSSGIIDLYHSETHSNSGIEAAIIRALGDVDDPGIRQSVRSTFQPYETQRQIFEASRAQAVGFDLIEKARSALREIFVASYNSLATQHPILIVLDTAELIQFETDVIQHICQIENAALEVKTWLTETLPQMKNSVILLAGRGSRPDQTNDPRVQLWHDLDSALAHVGSAAPSLWRRFELGGFSDEEGMRYFDAVVKRLQDTIHDGDTDAERRHLEFVVDRIQSVPTNTRAAISRSLEGRPIRLGMAIDLLIAGDELEPLLAPDAAWNAGLRNAIIERLYGVQLHPHLRLVLDYLAATRHGLDAELLHALEPGWSIDQCQQYLSQVQTLSFIKTRPNTQQVFLHDDMYDLMDEGVVRPQYGRFRTIYDKIASRCEHLADQLTPVDNKDEIETLRIKQAHYRLYDDPQRGFAVYVQYDQAAIEGYEFGFDMKLRDELLRFYSINENARAAAERGLSRIMIDHDSAARWIHRHLARDDNRRAAEVAEVVLLSGPAVYSSIPVRDVEPDQKPSPEVIAEARPLLANASTLFWGRVLTFYGEALLYIGSPFDDTKQVLDLAITILENVPDTESPEYPVALRGLLVGRAHNNRGYLYRSHGRYGQALEEYRHALRQFPRADYNERANTLNNLAYLLGLLGRTKLAKANIDEALAIRERINKRYPLALSRNTLGLIYTRDSHPMWGENACRDALRIFEELGVPRGIGLGLLGLGYALRQRGDQWKLGVYSPGEAVRYFQEAATRLQHAANIFETQIPEPIRLWEAYNELGSLYGDWGWFESQAASPSAPHTHEAALRYYAESIAKQMAAYSVAQENDLEFQRIDSYIDLAQVYGDRSYLYLQQGHVEEARKNRDAAEQYLSDVQTELVPTQFHLVPGWGLAKSDVPGVAYWLHLGKSHMWRGVWAFRDVESGALPAEIRAGHLVGAMHELITAAVYFHQYWPTAPDLDRTLTYLGRFLKSTKVLPEWAQAQVDAFGRRYPQLELKAVREAIEDTIGL